MKNHIWVVEESYIGEPDWKPLNDRDGLVVCYANRRDARTAMREVNASRIWSYRVRKYVVSTDKT